MLEENNLAEDEPLEPAPNHARCEILDFGSPWMIYTQKKVNKKHKLTMTNLIVSKMFKIGREKTRALTS